MSNIFKSLPDNFAILFLASSVRGSTTIGYCGYFFLLLTPVGSRKNVFLFLKMSILPWLLPLVCVWVSVYVCIGPQKCASQYAIEVDTVENIFELIVGEKEF